MKQRFVTGKLIAFAAFLVLLSAPSFVFANGTKESTSAASAAVSKPASVTFYMAEYDGLKQSYWTSLQKAFNDSQSQVHVHILGIGWNEIHNKLTTALAGGDPPQASIIGTRWLLSYVKNDEVVQPRKYVSPATWSNILPGDMTAKIDGKIWAIPDAAGARILAINTSFTKRIPKTMQQLEQDAIAANDPPNHAGLIMTGKKAAELSPFVYYFYAAGGHFFSHKPDGSLLKSDVNSAAGIQALTFMNKLANVDKVVQPGFLGQNREEAEPVFYAGKAAYVMIGAWVKSAMQQAGSKFPVEYAQIPPFAGHKPAPLTVADSIAFFKGAPHLHAMGKFIDFFYQRKWKSKFDEQVGFPPVTKSELSMSAFHSPLYTALNGAAEDARSWPLVNHWSHVSSIMWNAVTRVLLQQETPKAALDHAAAHINSVMGL